MRTTTILDTIRRYERIPIYATVLIGRCNEPTTADGINRAKHNIIIFRTISRPAHTVGTRGTVCIRDSRIYVRTYNTTRTLKPPHDMGNIIITSYMESRSGGVSTPRAAHTELNNYNV